MADVATLCRAAASNDARVLQAVWSSLQKRA